MKPALEPPTRAQKRSPLAMKCTINRAGLKPNSGTSVFVAVAFLSGMQLVDVFGILASGILVYLSFNALKDLR